MGLSTGAFYKRTAFRVLVSLALLVVCALLIDLKEVGEVISKVDPLYFIAALIINILGTVVIRAWIAYITTSASGLFLGFIELIRINLVARFYTIVLPRGGAAAVRWHHYRKGGDGHTAAALLLFENLISVWTLLVSATIILILEMQAAGPLSEIIFYVSFMGAVTVSVILMPFLHVRSMELCRSLLKLGLNKKWPGLSVVSRFLDSVMAYQKISRTRIIGLVAVSFAGYLMFVVSAWLLAEGMAVAVGVAAIAWVRSVTLLVALLPVTVAGIGLREGVMIALLQEYGVSASAAFAYAIASFSIQVFIGVMGAFIEGWKIFRGRTSGLERSGGGV